MGTIDEQTQRQSIFDVWPDEDYPGLHRDILAAIAAAVQAEREACAKICETHIERIKQDNMYPAYGLDGMLYEAERIATAIRARNGSK